MDLIEAKVEGKNLILKGLGKECKFRRDLVIRVQCITVASVHCECEIVPHTHPVSL